METDKGGPLSCGRKKTANIEQPVAEGNWGLNSLNKDIAIRLNFFFWLVS
jgi:hypothetical protein